MSWRAWLLALTLGVAAVLPLLVRGPSCGQDFDFHLQSWLAVRGAWQAGLPAPHWVPGANYGAGEPRFVFYPPLSWLLGALLGMVLPWGWAPAAFTGLCVAGAAAAMHRVASSFCSPRAAWLAAVVYAVSPYLLFTGYERAAYGELLAAVWMPLLLGALLAPRLPVGRTGVLLALLWYTNAPAGVMGCYLVLLAAVCGAGAASWRQGWVVLRAAIAELARGSGALALGCALAADYLVPAWYEQRFVSIQRAVGPGMRVEDSFLFGHTGEPYHDQVLRTASWIVVATLAVGLLTAGAVLVRRHRRRAARETADLALDDRGRAFALLVALAAVCGLLQLRWSDPVWRRLPELGFLQFPWRLMLPVSAAVALLAGMAVGQRDRKQILERARDRSAQDDSASGQVRRRQVGEQPWRAGLAMCAVLYAAGLVGWAAGTRWQACDEEDRVSAQLALPGGFEGTDEYAAAGSDNGEIQQGLPQVRLLHAADAEEGDDSGSGTDAANHAWKPEPGAAVPGAVQVQQWGPERFAARVHPDVEPEIDPDAKLQAKARLSAGTDAFAVLRLERSPAWRVLVNGAPCAGACVVREDGLVTVRMPAGRWSVLDVRYRTTQDVWVGRGVSALALLPLGWLFRRARRRASTRL